MAHGGFCGKMSHQRAPRQKISRMIEDREGNSRVIDEAKVEGDRNETVETEWQQKQRREEKEKKKKQKKKRKRKNNMKNNNNNKKKKNNNNNKKKKKQNNKNNKNIINKS